MFSSEPPWRRMQSVAKHEQGSRLQYIVAPPARRLAAAGAELECPREPSRGEADAGVPRKSPETSASGYLGASRSTALHSPCAGTAAWLVFPHPDYTVGTGISPVLFP
jgi:hypothetical protein